MSTSPEMNESDRNLRDSARTARTAQSDRDAGATAASEVRSREHASEGAARDVADRSTHDQSGDRSNRDGSRAAVLSDRASVVSREKKEYGGIKWGSAFFGWLTATGTAVILTAVLLAAGAAVGVTTDSADTSRNAGTIGVAGGIALLAVLLISYYCGGYVAGRMSRFHGVRQGIAVWVWAIVIAVLVAIAAAIFGDKYDVLAKLGGFPRLPINGGALSTAGIVAIVIALIAALVGAILGGLAGMRFHRNVDRAGLDV